MTNKQGTEKCCKECLEYIEINHIMGGIDTIEICTNKKCVCHSPQGDTPEEIEIDAILAGIDEEETTSKMGWWETSTGAEFGRKKKVEIKSFIHKLQQEAFEKGYAEGNSMPIKKFTPEENYSRGYNHGNEDGREAERKEIVEVIEKSVDWEDGNTQYHNGVEYAIYLITQRGKNHEA